MRAILTRWSTLLAVAVFAAGICSAALAGLAIHRKSAQIERSGQLLGRLSVLERKLDSIGQAHAHLAELDSSIPVDIDTIIQEAGLAEAVTDSKSGVSSLDDGWSIITSEIVFSDVVLTDLDNFIVRCHASRPSWVLTELSLKSSPFESGRARAAVTLQALRRKSN